MNIALDILLQWGPHGPHSPMGPHGGAGMGTWGGGMGPGWGLLWWFVVLALVVGVVVVAAVALLRQSDGEGEDNALGILRERYAAGDVDDEEFERRRERLDGPTS